MKIYITTDHGRDKGTGMHHGGQSAWERSTWIVTNATNLNSRFKDETPTIVDLTSTILRDLNIKRQKDRLWELDGVPVTGAISVAEAGADITNGKLKLSWKGYHSEETLKIWMSTTNKFSKGGNDKYRLVQEVKSGKERITIPMNGHQSNFVKS